jgi:hypothetical protein
MLLRSHAHLIARSFAVLIAVAGLTACNNNATRSSGTASVSGTSSVPETSGSVPETSDINAPPLITGTPTAFVGDGDYYVFIPYASDENEDPLTFSIENQPEWTVFDPVTGALSGVPSINDIGTDSQIIISVSDGLVTTTLTAFTITVNESAPDFSSVVLTWIPPTENEDGTTLTNLSAYRIYYGTSPDNLTDSIRINNPGTSSFVLDNLQPITYYFAASAVNSDGIESERSNVISLVAS